MSARKRNKLTHVQRIFAACARLERILIVSLDEHALNGHDLRRFIKLIGELQTILVHEQMRREFLE